jgi:hypothetical protein
VGSLTSAERGESVTITLCVNAAGQYIPPQMIVPRKRRNDFYFNGAPHATLCLQKIDEEPNFLSIVLTTDEAGFTRDGVFNAHNTHIWSEENLHQIRERGFQQRFSINMWAGIIGNRLIGLHVLPPHLNGEEYLIFLQNELSDLLDDVPLRVRRDMWCTGRNGPGLWPARSPDLNPCDFFMGPFKTDCV